jgi:Flp pilus assembly protein TadD
MQSRAPRQPGGYALEAAVHLRTKAPDAAQAAYRRGLAANPDSGVLARQLYVALIGANKAAEADRFSTGWVKSHPHDLGFHYQLSLTATARGDFDVAETALRHIVAEQPRNALVLNNLAMLLVTRAKPGALPLARQATDIQPANPALVDTLAAALAMDKQFDKALVAQKRAVALAPDQPILRLNLVRIALQAGDKDLARREIARLEGLGTESARQGDLAKLKGQL